MELKEKILEIFYLANQQFLNRNIKIVDIDINERTLCAQLSSFINRILEETELSDYYCDVEYNRLGNCIKEINHKKKIIPDLIIHSRGEKVKDNLLVLEMKKITSGFRSMDYDRRKLRKMTKQHFEEFETHTHYLYNYEVGVFYIIDTSRQEITLEIYHNSKLIKTENHTFEYYMNYHQVYEK